MRTTGAPLFKGSDRVLRFVRLEPGANTQTHVVPYEAASYLFAVDGMMPLPIFPVDSASNGSSNAPSKIPRRSDDGELIAPGSPRTHDRTENDAGILIRRREAIRRPVSVSHFVRVI